MPNTFFQKFILANYCLPVQQFFAKISFLGYLKGILCLTLFANDVTRPHVSEDSVQVQGLRAKVCGS